LSAEGGFAVHAAHFDHGLRGQQSAAEARTVAAFAEQWGLPCTIDAAPPGTLVSGGEGVQAAARRARYAFFDRVADAVGARWIATAHTADDQAETSVMRWVRGAGPAALAGIPAVRGRVLRPLLEVSRSEIEGYLAQHGIMPVRDPSNDDPKFLRVRIRRDVMPVLSALNPRAVQTMARAADLLADDAAYLEAAARAAYERAQIEFGGEWVEVDRTRIADLPMALRRRVIRIALAELGVPVDRVPAERIEAVARACAERTSGRLTVGLGALTEFASARVRLGRRNRLPPPPPIALVQDGEQGLPAWGLAVRVRRTDVYHRGEPLGRWEAAFESERLPGMLELRTRRPGDALFPVGMTGRKRVQDLLVDEKVPRWRRDQMPVLTAGDQVVWVVGLRRDRRYQATPGAPAIEVEVIEQRPAPQRGRKGA
jgi:tRNA(Ile)-lysidine synthase